MKLPAIQSVLYGEDSARNSAVTLKIKQKSASRTRNSPVSGQSPAPVYRCAVSPPAGPARRSAASARGGTASTGTRATIARLALEVDPLFLIHLRIITMAFISWYGIIYLR